MQVTPSAPNAAEGIIDGNPSKQMKIERIHILLLPTNSAADTAIALVARSLSPRYQGIAGKCPRPQTVVSLLCYFRKFLSLRRRQVNNDAVTFQVNLRGQQSYAMLAKAQEAADIGMQLGDLVVSATLKGRDLA